MILEFSVKNFLSYKERMTLLQHQKMKNLKNINRMVSDLSDREIEELFSFSSN